MADDARQSLPDLDNGEMLSEAFDFLNSSANSNVEGDFSGIPDDRIESLHGLGSMCD